MGMASQPSALAVGFTAALLAALLPPAKGFKVIGAGDPKTGLTALTEALQLLGYSVYRHFNQTVSKQYRSHRAMWKEALTSKSREPLHKLGDEIIALGFDAILDMPASWLTLQLWEHFPEAKVILTTRSSPGVWFESWRENAKIGAQLRVWPYRISRQNRLHIEIDDIIWGSRGCMDVTNGQVTEALRESCIASHKRQNAAVRAAIPQSQLLEYQVSQGWEPLCAFLNASLPREPFPQRWTRAGVTLARYLVYLNTGVSYLIVVALPVCLLRCCVHCLRCCLRRAHEKMS